MSTSTSNSKKMPQYGKFNFEECLQNFRVIVLNNINDIPRIKTSLITSGKLSTIEKTFVRPISWKIFLNVLPTNEKASLKVWLDETISQRKTVKKMIKNNTISKLKVDPLGGNKKSEKEDNSSGWEDFINQSETVKLIKSDIDKSVSEEKLLSEPYIKNMETTILTNFVKKNKKIEYKQGMNEVLALIIYAFYPYYVKSPNSKYTNDLIKNWVKNPADNAKDIYCFFHDENEFENDIYTVFENLMVKFGLSAFFEEDQEGKGNSYFNKRIRNIMNKKLSSVDRALYSHFQNQNLNFASAFQHWLKCLFKLQFPESDACVIWDYIFSHEAEVNSGMIVYLDYVLLAMIINVKYELTGRDNYGILQFLLTYPKVSPITNLLNLADKIAEELTVVHVEEPKTEEKKEETKEEEKDKDKEKEPEKEPEKTEEETTTTTSIPAFTNLFGNVNSNPLLLNPNLMVNPLLNSNMPNLPNMPNLSGVTNLNDLNNNLILAMMMNNNSGNNNMGTTNVGTTNVGTTTKETTNNTGTKNANTIQPEINASSALNELRGLVSKYRHVINRDDKDRMETLLDIIDQKLESKY